MRGTKEVLSNPTGLVDVWEPEPCLDAPSMVSLSGDGNGASESLGLSVHLVEQSFHIGGDGTAPIVTRVMFKVLNQEYRDYNGIILPSPPHTTKHFDFICFT